MGWKWKMILNLEKSRFTVFCNSRNKNSEDGVSFKMSYFITYK